MSYTFQPLADLEHNSHIGFFLVMVFLITVCYSLISWYRNNEINGGACIVGLLIASALG